MNRGMERNERVIKSTITHITMEVKETLKKLREDFPENPEGMGYFYELFEKVYSERKQRRNVKRIIGTLCIQVPEELIYAAGAIPLRLCSGSYSFEQIGSEMMPAKSCGLVKATVGMLSLINDLYSDPLDLIVIPTTCDQKKKAGEMLEEMGLKVYFLEIPSRKDTEAARTYWQASVWRFLNTLGEITGKRFTKKSIGDAIKIYNRAREEFRIFQGLRKAMPSPIYGKDAILITNAFFFDEIETWIEALTRLNNELSKRVSRAVHVSMKRPVRILLTGSPSIFPNLKLPLIIEQAGGVIVADDFCSSNRLLHDAVAFDEKDLYDMVPAIADRYLRPCTCPFITGNHDRRRRILSMIRDFDVDGVVYQAFSGCHLFEMEHKSIGKALEEAGIPMLYIETDYSPEDTGPLSTRVEAFLESIRNSKRKLRL
ncbi:MAG: double-cubane-cluster-containing anaerobic reductase [Thermodesulfovibrionales bacterium]